MKIPCNDKCGTQIGWAEAKRDSDGDLYVIDFFEDAVVNTSDTAIGLISVDEDCRAVAITII